MKKLTMLLSLALVLTMVMAVPAKKLKRTITLTDGSKIEATYYGDETNHFYLGNNGVRYVPSADNSHVFVALSEAKAKSRYAKQLTRTVSSNNRRAARLMAARKAKTYTGKKKGIIILVNFSDKKFAQSNTRELFDSIANANNYSSQQCPYGSVHDYFYSQSQGQFDLEFDVVGPVSLPHSYSYYGGNNEDNEDTYPATMAVDACKLVDSQVNFADYDWDGNGEVDQVFVLYAWHGEATYDDPNTVYPHEWELASSEYGRKLRLDGVNINTYACASELADEDDMLSGIGTICHEFSHCLGFPDMYDTEYENFGMGDWDLMDGGSYNGDNQNGMCPPSYSCYERMVAGWQMPIELKNDTVVSNVDAIANDGNTFIIYNPGHKDEFFTMENRQRIGWDAFVPDAGVLILHIDYHKNAWDDNVVNTTTGEYALYDHECATVVHADNSIGFYGRNGRLISDDYDVFPFGQLDSLTNNSTPNFNLYNMSADGTNKLPYAIRAIKLSESGKASFEFDNLAETATKLSQTSANETKATPYIYNMCGQHMGNKADRLPKGIYIIGGKRVVKE